jgi:hypothetical protein
MDVLTAEEIDGIVKHSVLAKKYNVVIENESAYEILNRKLQEAITMEKQEVEQKARAKPKKAAREESIFDNTAVKQASRTAASIITRSLLGALGLGGSRKRKSLF